MALLSRFLYVVGAIIVLSATLAVAHMEMMSPPPFKSKYNPYATDVDYDLTAPISQGQFPCKGYQSLIGTPEGTCVATWEAGSDQSFTLTGGAYHDGGSCQASISEDNGVTFKVIESYIGSCPLQSGGSFTFNVPKETKSGEVLFAWSWFNKVGNREMYMNCAAVTITNGGSGLASFPDIFVANIDNDCGTEEGFDVYFPNPGVPERIRNLSTSNKYPTGSCAPPVPSPPEGPPVPTLTPLGPIEESKVLSGTSDAASVPPAPPTIPALPTTPAPPTTLAPHTAPAPPTAPAPTSSPFTETPVKTSETSSPSAPPCSLPPQPHCECRCVVPDTGVGYVVDITPFGF